jgi:hypothetical protein
MYKRTLRAIAALALAAAAIAVNADPRDLAPGFSGLPKDAKVVIAPLDVELFSITGGGVFEPRADWTDAAQHHLGAALHAKAAALGLGHNDLDPAKADELAELLNLHGAVARAIALHHAGPVKLPTKEGRLDWSFGDALKPLQDASGARYALFTWVRDSYASAERVAMMVGLALLGVGVGGGAQVGYASLVDLESGRVLWFNQLRRVSGDLREAAKATESVEALLAGFPAIR